jgi:branched-chain amino acid transport system substrate-binding protein
MVSPTVTTTSLQAKDDYFIRVISTTADYASKIARYQFQKLGNRTAAVIYDLSNKAYTESWYSDFRDTFEGLGGRIVKSHTYTSNDEAVFFESVKGLLNVAPDVLVIISNSVDAALICQQVQKIDPRMSLALAEWASTERLTELGGSATEGASVSQFLDRNDTSAPYQEFRERYLDRFGQEPGFAGMAGYDAALVVLDALQNLEDGQALNKAIIDKGIFQGVQQSIIIDRFGDADRKVFVTTIRDGRYVTIE